MGNGLKQKRYQNMKGDANVGASSECPLCGELFHRGTSYNQINAHVDECMKDPEAAMEKKKMRDMENEIFSGTHQAIQIRRNTIGEKTVDMSSDVEQMLTIDRFREIQTMELEQLRTLETHEKMIWLRAKLDMNTPSVSAGSNRITVNRENLIFDSMQQFNDMQNPRQVLKVSFSSEVSQDVGGISREFFTQITKDMLSGGIGLFASGNTEEFSYIIAKDSREIQDYRQLFKFFGKLIGKAFFDRIPVNLCLNRQIYNALLGKTSVEDYANLEEFKEIDVSVYHSLKFFRDNDLSQHEDVIEQYFEHTLDESGYQVELRPGGSSERVTNENKHDFIKLKSHYISYKSAQLQLNSLVEGFRTVIPLEWIALFSADELETQMCGQNQIDLEDWKKNTELRGFFNYLGSMTLTRFWKIMATYNQQELGRVLQFCTGTSRVPLGGFAELESQSGQKAKFCIQKVEYDNTKGPQGNLPRAHTCFNRLDLPRYPDHDSMKIALDFIARNEILGFGMDE